MKLDVLDYDTKHGGPLDRDPQTATTVVHLILIIGQKVPIKVNVLKKLT